MADDFNIVVASPRHLSLVETWAGRNEATHTLLKTPRDPSHGTSSGQYWAALNGQEVVAIASIELNSEHVGYVNCVVKPGYLRQGIGSRMIEYVLSQPSVKNLAHLHAVVDPTNIAAQKILNKDGFSRVGNDENGNLEFARHAQK